MHSEICAVPAERLVIERELLGPLPSLRAGIGKMVTRKVDRLSCVRFASARYSVPVRLIGTEVRLRTDDGRLLVIMTGDRGGRRRACPGRARRGVGRAMSTTAARGPRPAGRSGRRPRRRRSSARSGRSPRRSSPARPRPGNTRLRHAELAELNTLRAAHGDAGVPGRAGPGGRVLPVAAADMRSILAAGAGVPGPGPGR